ncbi:translation initiation factor IF-2, mitochondrial [Cladorrhinum samala]|uniref:Translation initiation factor IF-2, mitochondrial n=1 Tax=Cladorrhinum samala TaxID=585594 RepID=A0AAV9HRF7_9PEZI|nr:translation initiation factor IF-2, mitochondrial [Cladorrhinum samala]
MTSDSPSRPAKQDPWTRLVRQAKEELEQTKEPRKTTATDDQTWDWVGDHVKESEEKKAAAATEAAGSEAPLNPNHANSEQLTESYRRHRFDVPEKEKEKEKPKKAKKRGYARDDDFDELDYQERRQQKAERKAEKERERLEALKGPIPILLPEFISVANLAVALKQKVKQFVKQLEELGFEDVSKDNIVTGETAALIAQEYGFEPTIETGDDYDLKPRPPPVDSSSLPPRPPVVTIMGHVDHGKTTLLDYLRKSSIVSQEHGGITQHIGAFSVRMSTGKLITFLDTPGHAAFLSMRQRGANVTDIVILVVAADDSVKPQTIEAIKHAQAAKVPIIVAINKIDKDSANIDRVKSDLAVNGLEIEDHGGDVQVVPVSGKTGQGMDDLEENILLLADMLDIRSETDGMAEGWVLESSIKPIGRAATVLVKRGTLRQGDFIVAGTAFTKIRSLRNEAGQEVTEAPPGTAVEVLGWKDPPEAGDLILQAPTEDRAKEAVHYRQEFKEREEVIAQMAEQEQAARQAEIEREKEEKRQKALENGEEYDEDADPESSIKYVNFTIKADVHGSVEAVTASILEQGNNQVRPKVLQSSSGQITESDVEHAAVSGASIVNFNNPIPGHIKRQAHDAGVKILDHNIIYHLIEDVTELLSEQLPPIISWRVVGEAEVLQIFPINYKGRKYKNIAGCRIRNGLITKNGRCRVLRGDKIVFEGTIDELKQGQKVISEIKKDSECGISFENWDDFKEGDHIQSVKEVVEKRTL